MAEEGLSVDVASGGELYLALRGGRRSAAASSCTATTRPRTSCSSPSTPAIGYLVLDSFAEIERAERLLDRPQDVLIRVTPGIKPSTHSYIQTGQLDSKFGFGLEDGLARRGGAARARVAAPATWSGSTRTSARRSSSSSPT